MKVVRTIDAMRTWRADRSGVALVPTMGALHGGHVALFRAARDECEHVAASLFVNPSQFGPQEDFERYPRDERRDGEVAEAAGVDVLFVPSVDELYPSGFDTWVDVGVVGAEGAARPGHFRGVATICLKLFNIVRPDVAYFGQKDGQQALVLRRMVRDLDLRVRVRIVPTVRDDDGLALSSRNAYLSADERRRARLLPGALAAGRDAFRTGGDPVAAARAALNGLDPEYVDVLELGDAKLLVAAARVGSTRLIDNVVLEGDLP